MKRLKQLNQYLIEWKLLILATLTYLLWFFKVSPTIVLAIYLGVFLMLFITKRPVVEYVVVSMFSVMGYHVVDFIIVDYVLVSVLLGGVVLTRIRERRITLGRLFWVLLIYLLYAAISIAWTTDKSFAIYGIKHTIQGYMVYLALINSDWKLKDEDKINITKVATFVMLTLTAEIMTIYFQHPFTEVISHKSYVNLGWGYSNFIAVIFTFLIPVAFYKYFDEENYRPIYFIIDLLNVGGLLLTQSRGAIVGAAVGIGLYGLLTFNKSYIKRYYTLGIGVGIIAIILFYPYITQIIERYIKPEFFDDNNRYPLYKLGLKKFLEAPIFGHGFKSSQYFIRNEIGMGVSNYHNYIIQIAATLGVVGLTIQGWLHYKWIKLFVVKDRFILCMGLGIVAALVHQLLDVSYDRYYFGVFMYAIIAAVELYRHQQPDDTWKLKEFSFVKR